MKRFLCFLIILTFISIYLSGCGLFLPRRNGQTTGEETPDTSSEAEPGTTGEKRSAQRICADIAIEADFANASVQGDQLTIFYIKAGMDDSDETIVSYSLSQQKVLGQLAIGRDYWSTGSLESGFYAISMGRREVSLYRADATLEKSKSFANGQEWAIAAVSPDEKYLLYAESRDCGIFVYDFQTGTSRQMGKFAGFLNYVGYRDGAFYINNENDLIEVNPEGDALTVVYSDAGISMTGLYYGAGSSDDGFFAVEGSVGAAKKYVSVRSINEVIFGCAPKGVFTVSSVRSDSLVNLYDISAGTVIGTEVSGMAAQVIPVGDNSALITTNAGEDGFPAVYLFDYANSVPEQIAVEESDPQSKPVEKGKSDTGKRTEVQNIERGKLIPNVPIFAQRPDYPTGCESASAVIAMNYAGDHMEMDDFIDHYLEKSAEFSYSGGKTYGPDPRETFVGSPRNENAFGCMAPVIEKALRKYYRDPSVVKNATGSSLEELCRQYIDRGIPVIVWSSIVMEPVYPSMTWILPSGEEYSWPANEHCMVLVGYDEDSYYYSDPYRGELTQYGKAVSEDRYEKLGRQALVIQK